MFLWSNTESSSRRSDVAVRAGIVVHPLLNLGIGVEGNPTASSTAKRNLVILTSEWSAVFFMNWINLNPRLHKVVLHPSCQQIFDDVGPLYVALSLSLGLPCTISSSGQVIFMSSSRFSQNSLQLSECRIHGTTNNRATARQLLLSLFWIGLKITDFVKWSW